MYFSTLLSLVYISAVLLLCNGSQDGDDNNFAAYDYVIVGGGPAGLSTMSFIQKLEPSASVLLIEKLGRIGGKGFTTYFTYYNDINTDNETISNIHFENNAMRFSNNGYLFYLLNYTDLCDDVTTFGRPGSDRTYDYRNFEEQRNIIIQDGGTEFENYWQYVYNFTNEDIELVANGAENTLRNEFKEFYNNGNNPANESQWFECLTEWELNGIAPKDWNRIALYYGYFNCSVEYINYRRDGQYPPFWDLGFGGRLCANPISNDPFTKPDGTTGGPKTLANGFGQISERLLELGTDYGTTNEYLLNTEVTGVFYSTEYYYDDSDSNSGSSSSGSDSDSSSSDENTLDLDEYKYFVRVRNTNDWTDNNDYVYYTSNNGDDDDDDDDDSSYLPIFAKNVVFSIPTRNFAKLFNSIDPWRNDRNIYDLIVDSRGRVEYGYRVNLIYNDDYIANNLSLDIRTQSKTDQMGRSIYYESNWRNGSLLALQFYSRREQAEWLDALQSIGKPYINENEINNFELDDISNDNIIYTSDLLVKQLVKELTDLFNYEFPMPIAAFSQPLGINDSNLDGIYLSKHGYINKYAVNELRHPNINEHLYVASGSYSSWMADIYGAIEAAYILVKDVLQLGDPFEGNSYCFF